MAANKPNQIEYRLNGRRAVLSAKDTYIPKDYIGMYSIFRNPVNKAVYVSEERCQAMRTKTFNAVLDLCKLYNTPNFAKLFNYNAQVIGEVGLNFFAEHDEINPIAGIIQCFEKVFARDSNNIYISFAINKDLLMRYFNTGICPRIKWSEWTTRDTVIFGVKDIKFYADKVIKVPKNQLYRNFQKWCKAKHISETDAIGIAMDLLMKKYKADGVDFTVGEYEPITILDRHLLHEAPRRPDEERTVNFSGLISSQADRIIDRWNRDPDNAIKKSMDFETYCNNALALLNKSMPMKYQDARTFYDDLKKKSKPTKN